jgi:hypothetical protein
VQRVIKICSMTRMHNSKILLFGGNDLCCQNTQWG